MPGRDSLFLLTREEEPFCGIVLKASSVQRKKHIHHKALGILVILK
jgi:hypothetical protein